VSRTRSQAAFRSIPKAMRSIDPQWKYAVVGCVVEDEVEEELCLKMGDLESKASAHHMGYCCALEPD
jgi:hypothetical protein